MCNIDCDNMFHGATISFSFSCWQHLTWGCSLVVEEGVLEENTKKLTELMANESSNRADFFIGIISFFG